jgi:NAD(P)-dependent dehydrogenase (short-subunit alcohol dehydrogenase family)
MNAMLRQGLLDSRVFLAAVPAAGPGAHAAATCEGLGAIAHVHTDALPDEEAAEAAVARAVGAGMDLDALLYEPRLPADDAGLVIALDHAWNVVRAAANAAFIPQERGRIVLIGPRPDGGVHAEALRDGLENMARTLSIEWARFGILPTMVAPGTATTDDEVATLVAYLVSDAGDYYSGCRFDLGSV